MSEEYNWQLRAINLEYAVRTALRMMRKEIDQHRTREWLELRLEEATEGNLPFAHEQLKDVPLRIRMGAVSVGSANDRPLSGVRYAEGIKDIRETPDRLEQESLKRDIELLEQDIDELKQEQELAKTGAAAYLPIGFLSRWLGRIGT